MANSPSNFAKLVAFLLFFFLIFSTQEMKVAEAKVCEKRSTTWSGWCGVTSHCDRQCKNWEGATHGACHYRFPGSACFCYFNC